MTFIRFFLAPYSGNPAAVVFEIRSERWMQDIASENNLAETSFLCPLDAGYDTYLLRWFTPTREVKMIYND